MSAIERCLVLLLTLVSLAMVAGCAGGGGSSIRYSASMGYHGGYYGRAPYGYYDSPDVIFVPDDSPVAMPLSEPDMDFGMPDAGFDDFGGFDF